MQQGVDNGFDAGSFRDRQARVFYHEGKVYRGLSATALEEWQRLSESEFFPRLMKAGKIVDSKLVPTDTAPSPPDAAGRTWQGLLSHVKVPFISYPYEWAFSMLRDAALLQLELLTAALGEDMILKDSSSFNVQWLGAKPTFIDVASFERLQPGAPWVGYRQFCQLFLYPLMLQAYRDISFHAWLRGSIDGIEPYECRQMLTARDLLRAGTLTHVFLQSMLQQRYGAATHSVKESVQSSGFNKSMIEANVGRLAKLVAKLEWQRAHSEWSGYREKNTYSEEDHEKKVSFVEEVCTKRSWPLVWDIGCNTGTFSRIAAQHADYVVAMDADTLAVELLYRELAEDGPHNILPLVVNLADPPPNLGWRGRERKGLEGRGTPDLTLCLALVHHLVITANIPMTELIEWIAGLDSAVVFEFVSRSDSMVETLLRNKDDDYSDYTQEHFEEIFAHHFRTVERRETHGGSRVLYYGEHK